MGESDNTVLREKKLGTWLLVLCGLVFCLMVLGGIVRLTGSGLSIPDWPLINGTLLPPVSETGWEAVYKTYHRVIEGVEVEGIEHAERPGIIPFGRFKVMFAIEYLHRFVAAIVGLIFLIIFIQVMRAQPIRQKIGSLIWIAGFLLLLQAILGGIVVKTDLEVGVLLLHLGTGFLYISFLVWMALTLLRTRHEQAGTADTASLKWAWIAAGLVYIQVLSGALMAGSQAGFFMNTFPKMLGHWIPPIYSMWTATIDPMWRNIFENKVLIQFIHRWWAFIAAAGVVILHVKTLKVQVSKLARIFLRGSVVILLLQLLLGIGALMMSVPIYMGVMHLGTGILLFVSLVVIIYELRYVSMEVGG